MTQTFKTITGEVIRVSSNKSKKTFTLRIRGAKYRTSNMSKLEFSECEYMTGNDWINYLMKNECIKIK